MGSTDLFSGKHTKFNDEEEDGKTNESDTNDATLKVVDTK